MPTTLPVRRNVPARSPHATTLAFALLALMAFFGAGLSLAHTSTASPPVHDSYPPPVIFADFGSPDLAWPIPIPP